MLLDYSFMLLDVVVSLVMLLILLRLAFVKLSVVVFTWRFKSELGRPMKPLLALGVGE
jgi:hypothetical protein